MRTVIENLTIGSVTSEELREIYRATKLPPRIAEQFITTETVPLRTVKLIAVRNYELGLSGFTGSKELFAAAAEKGLCRCPDCLPFQFVKQVGEKSGNTFVFAVEPRLAYLFATGQSMARIFLSVHEYHGFSYALDQPYGGGVEFVFVEQ